MSTGTGPIEPLDSLDPIFELPDHVDDKMKQLYEVVLARLRREISDASHSTVLILLVERIAYNYIVLRQREAAPDGFTSAGQQKDFNSFWLSMAQEYHRQTKGNEASVIRAEMASQIAAVLNDALAEIPSSYRKSIQERLVSALSEVGL